MDSRIETIIDDEKMGLWYHPEEKIVHHKIKKFIYGDDFQKLLSTGLDIFLKNGCRKWLSDDQSNTAIRHEDLAWNEEHWRPKVIEGGWKYWALVMPSKVLAQIPMKPLIEKYAGLGVTVEIFSNADEAFEWLAAKE